MRDRGITRKDIRQGGGTGEGVAAEHFGEMIGSIELYIYRHPNRKIKGFEALKVFLESEGCEVVHITDALAPVGQKYETIRVTNQGREILEPLLRRAHSWAHQRNLLHMFYKKR